MRTSDYLERDLGLSEELIQKWRDAYRPEMQPLTWIASSEPIWQSRRMHWTLLPLMHAASAVIHVRAAS